MLRHLHTFIHIVVTSSSYLIGHALASAPINPAYAMNEAYTNENNDAMDSVKVAVNQDVKLTENIY